MPTGIDPPFPLHTSTFFGWCQEHGHYQSAKPGYPLCPPRAECVPMVLPGWWGTWTMRPQPPPVCTGSGHGPGAAPLGSGFTGICGICKREVAMIWTGSASICATHPYEPEAIDPPSAPASGKAP